jgi:hypothetical protein
VRYFSRYLDIDGKQIYIDTGNVVLPTITMKNISIKVNTVTIQQLIEEEVASGKYWLPTFQRQYVWDSDNIKELLDSIVHNYPIGAIILWNPSPEKAGEIDPTAAPLIDNNNSMTNNRFYVIDGQQRLTSILLLFNGWNISRENASITCDPIAYDFAHDKYIRHYRRGIDVSKIILAFYKHDMETLNEIQNSYLPEVFNKIRNIAQEILNYPIPQYVMTTVAETEDIFPEMAETFVRVNKEGVKIGNVELMLSFMAGTLKGDVKNKVQVLYRKYESKDTTMQPIIRSVFSNFGLSQTQLGKPKQFKTNIQKIKEIDPGELNQRLNQSEKALDLTFDFLKDKLNLISASLVPTHTSLIPITTYFSKSNLANIDDLPEQDGNNMEQWFVLVNLNGHYSASVDSRLNKDIEIIRNSQGFPFDDLQQIMKNKKQMGIDFFTDGLKRNVLREANKAYLFLLYLLLTKNRADDWTGKLLAKQPLKDFERHHIFPIEYLQKELELDDVEDAHEVEIQQSNFANITYILKEVNGSIGDEAPTLYLPQYNQLIPAHFVPNDVNLWTTQAYKENQFQEKRVTLLYEAFKRFFPKIAI